MMETLAGWTLVLLLLSIVAAFAAMFWWVVLELFRGPRRRG